MAKWDILRADPLYWLLLCPVYGRIYTTGSGPAGYFCCIGSLHPSRMY